MLSNVVFQMEDHPCLRPRAGGQGRLAAGGVREAEQGPSALAFRLTSGTERPNALSCDVNKAGES